ncbi:BTAD domain-containing putative transcriptional regulator [Streptomyces sp. NPDC093085]|uniref:AfsR/SARP family transcriptional regulator n=1 Tax=Streptomyces sp. NPDC093085 TaxID=3155068 RepID=UPI00343236F7
MSTWNNVTVRLLGPPALVRGTDVIPVPGQRQRRFFTSLALRAGHVVSKETISEDSWDGEPPLTVAGQLQTSAWMIRRVLEQAGLSRSTLGSYDHGYELRVPPEAVDLFVFRDAVRQARDKYALGLHRDASDLLNTALTRWTGPAFPDVTSSRLRRRAEALEQERKAAFELRALIDIGLGHYTEAISRLSELVGHDPFREDLYASLMRAYYAEGRQADAIRVYHQAKKILREQIGINPGTRMVTVMEAILRQDEQLFQISNHEMH